MKNSIRHQHFFISKRYGEATVGIEHEWRQEYEQCRYLREITEEGLKSRYNALIGNLWSTDASGKVTPPRNEGARRQLLR